MPRTALSSAAHFLKNNVHNADIFEVLGAFGTAKAFTTGDARSQTMRANLSKLRFRTLYRKRIAAARAFLVG